MDADKQAEARELPEKLVTLFALAWAVLRNRSIRFFRHSRADTTSAGAGNHRTLDRSLGGAFRLFCTFRLFLAGSTATLAKKPEAGAKAVKEEDCFQSQTAICTLPENYRYPDSIRAYREPRYALHPAPKWRVASFGKGGQAFGWVDFRVGRFSHREVAGVIIRDDFER